MNPDFVSWIFSKQYFMLSNVSYKYRQNSLQMENNIGRDWSWMMCDLCYIYFCTLYIITCHDIEGDNNDMVVIIGGNGKPCIVFSSRSDISTTQSHCHCHCHCHCPRVYLLSDISTNRQERSRTGTLRATNYCSFFVSTFPLLVLQISKSLFLKRISPSSPLDPRRPGSRVAPL